MKRETKSEGRLLSIGIDVGTSAIKLAIVDDVPGRPRALLLKSERLRRRDPRALAQSLYDEGIASMEGGGSYNQTDAEGFLRIQGLPSRVQGRVTPRSY